MEVKAGPTGNRIGAAWPTKDGTGLVIDLDAYPVNGRIVILPSEH